MVRFSVSLSNAIFSFITTLQQLNLGIKKDAYIYAPYVPRFSDAQRVSLFNNSSHDANPLSYKEICGIFGPSPIQ